MKNIGNIEKRIKRHVVGKSHVFFISTLPGIEPVCFDALSALGLADGDARMEKGGIEFIGRVHDCYLANLHLRTANRILMRLVDFSATNFRQLKKNISDFPWELYLKKNTDFKLHVTSKHSRLIHTEAIAERINISLDKRLSLLPDPVKSHETCHNESQQIFVRGQNDRFTVSIDSSGDLLHKRGLKVLGGSAPIRETMAAAILHLAGYQAGDVLLDPMCGTGTFSLEAAMMSHHIPAGWYREFTFMNWPAFKPARWTHIRREAENKILKITKPVIFASDIDPECSRRLQTVIEENDLSHTVKVSSADFFDLNTQPLDLPATTRPGLVVLNPPYGMRLGSDINIDGLFKQMFQKLKKDFKGWRAAVLVPEKRLLSGIPFKVQSHDFFHGGIHVTLVVGRID